MAPHQGTPLAGIPGWTPELIDKLAAAWITTAEQVVGTAATAGGVPGLARQLGVQEPEMRRLVARARAALPPSVAAQLDQPVDASQYGLGALPPETNS
jgi:hypothetical protein